MTAQATPAGQVQGALDGIRVPDLTRMPPAAFCARPPLLGQHNEEIHSTLGYTREQIAQLARQNTI